MLLQCCSQYGRKFGKLSSGRRTGKVFILIQKKGNAKECSNFCTIVLILHASKMLKILQARLQQHMNQELPDVQAGFRKGRGTINQIAKICWVIEKKQMNSIKTSTSASLIVLKPLTGWITTNWKILKENRIPDYITCLLRNVYADWKATVRPRHGIMDWFQTGKEYIKAVYCHLA